MAKFKLSGKKQKPLTGLICHPSGKTLQLPDGWNSYIFDGAFLMGEIVEKGTLMFNVEPVKNIGGGGNVMAEESTYEDGFEVTVLHPPDDEHKYPLKLWRKIEGENAVSFLYMGFAHQLVYESNAIQQIIRSLAENEAEVKVTGH